MAGDSFGNGGRRATPPSGVSLIANPP